MKHEVPGTQGAGQHRPARSARKVSGWWQWPLRIAISQLIAAALRWIIEHVPW